ncbi:hypothetical protein [Phaeobacter inhibens]|uniref:hypothetical protein n=1 Tax=Phaeobacter inhibens TaxID=221822 RepID=UPI0021A93AD8|nr:hypothetical protein [Phaeobacter inhibens]UWR44540.1 hypothetical protein K4F86_14520 [Phaeobacter inhibens]
MIRCITLLSLIWLPAVALADDPHINDATVQQTGNSWRISVTLTHPDSGWDHYADGWRVLDTDGKVLGLRELAHPHVNEQPFTRSLAGVTIPKGIDTVLIQARCNVDGWSEATYVLPLVCSSC